MSERYRIVALVGQGGMGEVYRADDLKIGQTVALKFLPRDLERHPERLQRLFGEVRMARQVAHPNMCRVYDVGEFLAGNFDAATAGYEVGYDDASHFSREYKGLFGQPPLRDVERLRGVTSSTTRARGSR